MRALTNGQVLARGVFPVCEWHPDAERPARTGDPFHARAEVVGGKRCPEHRTQDRQLRVCRRCAQRPEVAEFARTPGKGITFYELKA